MWSVILLFVACLFPKDLGAADATPGPPLVSQEAGKSVRVEFFAKPYISSPSAAKEKKPSIEAGRDLQIQVRITDSHTRNGISGLHPLGWITPRDPGAHAPDQKACEEKIKTLLGGGLSALVDTDLNGFYLLTLNADNTISIINPQVNFSSSNLLALIPLKGKAAEWVLDRRTGFVYVTLPEEGQVAVVDIKARDIMKYLQVGTTPTRIRQQPDGRYVWVGNNGSGTVSVIDSEGLRVVKTFTVGAGPLDLSFDARGEYAFVGAASSGTVSLIDTRRMTKRGTVAVGKGDMRLTHSQLSKMAYAANVITGEITIFYPESGQVVKNISLAPGIRSLTPTPDGRFVFALNPNSRTATVIDTAHNNIVQVLPTEADPDYITFSQGFAYIGHTSGVHLTLIQLSGLGDAQSPPIIRIPLGASPSKRVPGLPGISPIAIMPGGSGALIANPSDRMIYGYMEGMMAPSYSFKTFTAAPLGLFVYERNLQEGSVAGVYETTVRLQNGGTYDVPIFLTTPRVAVCFELTVHGNPLRPKKRIPPLLTSRFSNRVFRPGEVSTVQFELHDPDTAQPISGIKDVRVLSFLRDGSWQARVFARPLENGLYEAELTFPREGQYYVLVGSHSLRIAFGDIRHTFATVSTQGKEPLLHPTAHGRAP